MQNHWWLLILVSAAAAAQDTQRGAFGLAPPTSVESLEELRATIAYADAEDLFSVEMAFAAPARLDAVREAAVQLRIPRLLAFVEVRAPREPSRRLELPPVGLGTLYEEADSWQKEVCRARIYAELSGIDALEAPPSSWRVREVHVYGSAYAVRELQAGTLVPRAEVVDGMPQERQYLESLAAATTARLAEPISIPANVSVSAECRSSSRPIDAPILAGRRNIAPRVPADGDSRNLLQQQLSEYTPEIPVTLEVSFQTRVNAEALASFVEDYRIDGLIAEFTPAAENDRVIVLVELSIHGAPLDEQLLRAQCQIETAATSRWPATAWATRGAQISVRAASAWQLLTVPSLQRMRLIASFEPGSLSRLVDYHARKAEQPVPGDGGEHAPSACALLALLMRVQY